MTKAKKNMLISVIGFIFILMSIVTIFFNVLPRVKTIDLRTILNNANGIFLFFSYLVCGIGIMKRKIWARYISIFLLAWFFANNTPLIIYTENWSKSVLVVFSVISLIIIYYLSLPNIKELFKH